MERDRNRPETNGGPPLTTLKQLKVKLLDNPTVQAEYDALADEFNLAHELIAARARAGRTHADVATRIGTTHSVVARLEG